MSARKLGLSLTVRAQDDLLQIWLYTLDRWGVDQAVDYDERLNASLELLRENPRLGRARDDLRPGMRGLLVGEHVILYRLMDGEVVVQHIIHGKQDIDRELRD